MLFSPGLRRFGPGLVSEFETDRNFKDGKGSYMDDPLNPPMKPEKHSMLLIGYRPGLCKHSSRTVHCFYFLTDPKYGYVFLLQNWWKRMEFLEVSPLYMARSTARINFVMEPLRSIPERFQGIVMDVVAAEANDGGGGDTAMPEY